MVTSFKIPRPGDCLRTPVCKDSLLSETLCDQGLWFLLLVPPRLSFFSFLPFLCFHGSSRFCLDHSLGLFSCLLLLWPLPAWEVLGPDFCCCCGHMHSSVAPRVLQLPLCSFTAPTVDCPAQLLCQLSSAWLLCDFFSSVCLPLSHGCGSLCWLLSRDCRRG